MQLAFGGKPDARRENLDYTPTPFVEWMSFREDIQGMPMVTNEDGVWFEQFSWTGLQMVERSNERPITHFSNLVLAKVIEFSFLVLKIWLSPLKPKPTKGSSNIGARSFTVMELSSMWGGYRADHLVVWRRIGLLPVEVKSQLTSWNFEGARPTELVE